MGIRNYVNRINYAIVLAQSAVAMSHTGNTDETTLATITVPANAMGANGRIRIITNWSYTNSANNKQLRVRFGGIGGTVYLLATTTTTVSGRHITEIANRGAANSQFGSPSNLNFGNNASAATTSAIDTTAAVDIVLTAQLTNSGETITLESYSCELLAKV